MDFYVLRNKKMVDELCERLKERRLPFKVALQDIYPLRSLDANSYLWGIVYSAIADETGHSIDEIHEHYKRLYNLKQQFRYNPRTKKMQFYIGTASTTTLNEKEFWEYIMRVVSDAELFLRILIPLPNEVFINELNFNFENTHQTKRL